MFVLVLACAAYTDVPPGTTRLAGGPTLVGAKPAQVQALIDAEPEAALKVLSLARSTPQLKVDVAPFHLAVTETTGEQYAAFLKATGHRPPVAWGAAAVEEARVAYLGEGPQDEPFDGAAWWDAHWQECDWELPEGAALLPVHGVSYQDAIAYCLFAGLRLPSEAEFECAVQGPDGSTYPWGNQWVAGNAATEEGSFRGEQPVGSFPGTQDGVHDLVGNLWEWTSTRLDAYPGFESHRYVLPARGGREAREVEARPDFDRDCHVVKGGSYASHRIGARSFVRRPLEPWQRTEVVGFRGAASASPGRDHLALRLQSDLAAWAHRFDVTASLGFDRWETAAARANAPSGYAVITGYEYFAVAPRMPLDEKSEVGFRRASMKSPVEVALLSSSRDFAGLPAGTYRVLFRAKGTVRGDEDPWESRVDTDKDQLIFLDPTGDFVAAAEGTMSFGRAKRTGVSVTENEVTVALEVPTPRRSQVMAIGFMIALQEELAEDTWRGLSR